MHLKMDDLVTGRLFNLKKYKYREELTVSINRINVNRGKITSTIFIVMEAIILVASLTLNKSDYAHKTGLYYEIMYTLLIIIMTAYLLIFAKLGKDICNYHISMVCRYIPAGPVIFRTDYSIYRSSYSSGINSGS